jgi:hypothetical protein
LNFSDILPIWMKRSLRGEGKEMDFSKLKYISTDAPTTDELELLNESSVRISQVIRARWIILGILALFGIVPYAIFQYYSIDLGEEQSDRVGNSSVPCSGHVRRITGFPAGTAFSAHTASDTLASLIMGRPAFGPSTEVPVIAEAFTPFSG